MTQFDKSKIIELKDCLYNSDSHDAVLKNSNYDIKNKIFYIDIFNPIFDVEINFTFYDVKTIMFFKGNFEFGDSETINYLGVEEDYSYIKNYSNMCNNEFDDTLYLLFEMFSGDELHIVFKEVSIDIQKYKK